MVRQNAQRTGSCAHSQAGRIATGLAARGKYFFQGDLQGPHAGLALEYLRSRVDNDGDQLTPKSSYLIPRLEGVYRFAFGSFFVDPVAAVGYAALLDATTESLSGGDTGRAFVSSNESSVYGSLRVDFGLFL